MFLIVCSIKCRISLLRIQTKLEIIEMWIYRQIPKISWTIFEKEEFLKKKRNYKEIAVNNQKETNKLFGIRNKEITLGKFYTYREDESLHDKFVKMDERTSTRKIKKVRKGASIAENKKRQKNVHEHHRLCPERR